MSKTLFLVLVVIVIAAAIYYERRRGEGMETTASRLGLDYRPERRTLPPPLSAADFDLFRQGPPDIRYYMEGRVDGQPVALFEFTYTATISGEGQAELPIQDDQVGMERRAQTVVWLRLERQLPDFDLAPARGIHQRKVASRFGFSPVTFDGDDPFNRQYRLLGRDAERLRHLFPEPVRRFLLAHPGLVLECRGRELLIYRFEGLTSPKQLPAFLQESRELLQQLESATR